MMRARNGIRCQDFERFGLTSGYGYSNAVLLYFGALAGFARAGAGHCGDGNAVSCLKPTGWQDGQ